MLNSKTFLLEQWGFDGLKQRSIPVPELGPRQVLIEVQAASLNFRDLKILKGHYARPPKLPVTLLSDGAGKIINIGIDITQFSIGDRVIPIYMSGWHDGPLADRHAGWKALGGDVNGVASEFVICHEDDLLPIPNYLSYEHAACIPCAGVTAWHALVFSGNVKAGDTVLLLGSGGVSVFSLQIAKMSGARVIATSSKASKLKRLLDLGAWEVINYQEIPQWGEKVLGLTDGRGVDHVVEVGGKDTIKQSLRATKNSGHIGIIGDLSGGGYTNKITERKISMTKITVGSRQMTRDLLQAMEYNKELPVIDKIFNFDELKSALAYLESGQHFGKVVINFKKNN